MWAKFSRNLAPHYQEPVIQPKTKCNLEWIKTFVKAYNNHFVYVVALDCYITVCCIVIFVCACIQLVNCVFLTLEMAQWESPLPIPHHHPPTHTRMHTHTYLHLSSLANGRIFSSTNATEWSKTYNRNTKGSSVSLRSSCSSMRTRCSFVKLLYRSYRLQYSMELRSYSM